MVILNFEKELPLHKLVFMIHSMTGFGKASGTFENKNIRVEIKSLNSKSLDLHVRMPYSYKEKEIDLRKKIAAKLDRGKIGVLLK